MVPKICPICGDLDIKISYRARTNSNMSSLKASGFSSGNRSIYKCFSCTVFFCYPIPSAKELFLAYDEEEDHEFVSQNRFRYRTFQKYFSDFIEERKLNKSRVFVTDIGAASGVFLSYLQSIGIESMGFEASRWLVNYGKSNYNIDLRQGEVDDFCPRSNSLNVVTMWDVLEHLPNPMHSIATLSSKNTDDSIIFLSLPSTDSKTFKLLRWKWPMHLDVHLFYFNKRSLEVLFAKFGYKCIYSSHYWQRISIGYLIYRILQVVGMAKLSARLSVNLTSQLANSISVPYSVGQRIYVFERIS